MTNIHSTMTDMNHTANLPPCGRRWLMRNEAGYQIWCRPPVRPPGLTDEEALNDPEKWFKKRQVPCVTCLACNEREPERPRQPGFDLTHVADPSADRIPKDREFVNGDPHTQPLPPEIRDDGTIIYPKIGWEPPPVPPGYKRKSDDLSRDDAWTLVRIEPLCTFCKLVQTRRKNCGCLRVVPTCTYRGKSENIDFDRCDSCPDKK